MHNDRCSEMMVELQRTIVHASFGETGLPVSRGKNDLASSLISLL